MKLFTLQQDLTLIGIHVKSFPMGIKEAFDGLYTTYGTTRAYYGLSWMNDDNEVEYYAMALQASPGAAQDKHFETITIKKGDYRTETIHGWMSKTGSIKDVFHNLMGENKTSRDNPCIEWYKSDDELVCMVKA